MSKRKEKDGTVPGPPDSSPQIVSAGSEVAGAEGARVVGSEVIGETVGAGVQRPQANGQSSGSIVMASQNPLAAREVQLAEEAKPGMESASTQTIGEAVGGGESVGNCVVLGGRSRSSQ